MTTTLATANQAWINAGPAFKWFCDTARPPRRRTMLQFASDELVLPTGPWKGEKFRPQTQPWSRLLINAMDSWREPRIVATGPVQSGKSLIFYVLPIMYHCFEENETVIVGLPDMNMASDKWLRDIYPAIMASRYRDEIPKFGAGSRSGDVELITFKNGGAIRFMSGGGGDATRAAFTARVLVITEADKMAKAGPASQEANKISQLEARTRAYGSKARIYKECTVTVEEGCVWQGYTKGTHSRILTPCPHCKVFVEFTRDELHGWREASSAIEAREKSHFVCPSCQKPLSEADRTWSNRHSVLVHRGQKIDDDGKVTGEIEPTDTLGLRWSGFHNEFLRAGEFGMAEWSATRQVDLDDAEKEMRQFWWCLPYIPSRLDMSALDPEGITKRITNERRGIVPKWANTLTLGVDVGKYLLHYQVIASGKTFRTHLVDYGVIEVPSTELGVEKAVTIALRKLRDMADVGWPDADGRMVKPIQAWVDCGWQGKKEEPDFVYDFIRETNGIQPLKDHVWRACKGFGSNQYSGEHYRAPLKVNETTLYVGDHYHLEKIRRDTGLIYVVHFSADHWKMFFHRRLATPVGRDGAMTLFNARDYEHLTVARHYTAERQIEEYDPRRGYFIKWESVRKANHYLDAGSIATIAAHWAGVRLDGEPWTPPAQRTSGPAPVTGPGGVPFLATQRR